MQRFSASLPNQSLLCPALIAALREFFGSDPRQSADYCRIVSDGHVKRLMKLIEPRRDQDVKQKSEERPEFKVLLGGWEECDAADRFLLLFHRIRINTNMNLIGF
jgi:hypothetical protein